MKICKIIIIIAIIGIIVTCIAPYILTQCDSSVVFDQNSGVIGDTIGGTTAPIIGILSIVLLSFTLIVQIRSNEKQQEFAANEQFKSAFFNLLQTQRDILAKLKITFSCLKNNLYEIKHVEIVGIDVFTSAKEQLELIYKGLNYNTFYNNYDQDSAYQKTVSIGENIIPDPYLFAARKEQCESIAKKKLPFQLAYVNDSFSVSKEIYNRYKNASAIQRIRIAYSLFFGKYDALNSYFRHLYHILQFVRSTENERLNNRISESKKNKIHAQFKQYAQFVQAQMSTDELLLLYYHSFIQKDLQELIIHYDLLENLPIKDLIVPEHYCNPKIKLSNKEELQRYLETVLN